MQGFYGVSEMVKLAIISMRYSSFAGFLRFYSFPTREKRKLSLFGKNK